MRVENRNPPPKQEAAALPAQPPVQPSRDSAPDTYINARDAGNPWDQRRHRAEALWQAVDRGDLAEVERLWDPELAPARDAAGNDILDYAILKEHQQIAEFLAGREMICCARINDDWVLFYPEATQLDTLRRQGHKVEITASRLIFDRSRPQVYSAAESKAAPVAQPRARRDRAADISFAVTVIASIKQDAISNKMLSPADELVILAGKTDTDSHIEALALAKRVHPMDETSEGFPVAQALLMAGREDLYQQVMDNLD